MPVQYISDEDGNKTAVIVPIEEWEAIWKRLEVLTPEEEMERAEAMAELERGEALDLQQAMEKW